VKANILWIEGKRAEGPSFISSLRKKGYEVEIAPTGIAALTLMATFAPDLVVVNAASLRTSGKRICMSLREQVDGLPIVVIASKERLVTDEACANAVLTLPFTLRKLLNRIVPLLPGDGENVLHAGPIRLDMERKRVRCQGKEVRLTPRLARLLQVLIQNHGAVLERGKLFSEVWNTTYTEDTRTLDVHISWLRQAIEVDPRKPQYLKTVRGMGYRLDIS
jgi:DNA-binding response OmpR family regulator